ncbi:hypothetical protein RHMOL_Rhmol01G0032600 [Rhododendron molle]|uniref:Uncharacterized protein n=1 Tax=Rhododendron molle TaxID=49168 RepID=A0ACC0PZ26_RHOML|nr:hypothetical protein RHMOL_Rhmol01G0032600 [Rhododendron molle]
MTLEEIKGSLGGENDKFPVGMRVLAVDDDRIWLRILDELLRKCQYHVTTTNQAKAALKLLRENRNRFDLVISDVHMPDMDGFKLLELVGLEMDLPVIMLSGNGDPKLVMKGITHGACDYLVKPVRIEELRNIWQHVIRKKKFDSKSENNSNAQDKGHQGGGQAHSPDGATDQIRKVSRKRKEDEEEEQEEEEGEENGHENEDPATQKKPRVVWSIELHRKFVAAVNQLGIEKAVPKRILDMMNVEGLTRENVASHLQKYRLYLKRISSVATQQANMVAALGGKDASYMRMSSLDGLGDFRTLAGPGRYSNSNISPYQTGGILGRLNSPAGMNLRSLSSSALFQPGHAQNLTTLGKLQPVVWPSNQNPSLFQGIPTSLGLGPFQPGGASSSPFTVHGNGQHMHDGGLFSSQPSFKVGSLTSEPFNTAVGGSNESWHSTVELPNYSPNSLSLSGPFDHDRLNPNSVRSNNSSTATHIQNGPLDFSSTNSISAPMEDSRGEIHFQAGSVGNVVRNMNQEMAKRWDSNQIFSPLNSVVPANGVVSPLSQSMGQTNGVFHRKTDPALVSRSHSSAPTHAQHIGIEKSFMDPKMRSNEDYTSEQTKSPGGHVHGGYESLDDIMNAMIKREQEGSLDGEFGFGAYTFG